MPKTTVAILFGGKSHEHEISLCSAAAVLEYFDRDQFVLLPIFIDKSGRWWQYDLQSLQIHSESGAIMPQPHAQALSMTAIADSSMGVDVVFPMMHGPLCEDGCLQGLFEMLNIPYVGANVLSSALSMDKAVSKNVVAHAGVNVARFVLVEQQQWQQQSDALLEDIAQLGLPCFVKPNNTGSSVGVSKVTELSQLQAAMQEAFQYHDRVIIEECIVGREIEVAVLENIDNRAEPLVSLAGEVITHDRFYSYEKKYLHPEQTQLVMPADVSKQELAALQSAAKTIFIAMQSEGMARVDLFLESESGRVFFNELNALPGFTRISMYPKLWQLSGIAYTELLTRLVCLAIARFQRRQQLQQSYLALNHASL